MLGGVAHLLNFDGTDTMSAAYYAQARPWTSQSAFYCMNKFPADPVTFAIIACAASPGFLSTLFTRNLQKSICPQ